MANPDHLKILQQGVDAWSAWMNGNPDITPNLDEADLSGADLSEANLGGAALSGAHLNWAHLLGANLNGAFLNRASLREAALIRASLSRANLNGASLVYAAAASMSEDEPCSLWFQPQKKRFPLATKGCTPSRAV